MSEPLRLITPPAAEPVALKDFKSLMRISSQDSSRDSILQLYLTAARKQLERYCRIAIVTQHWLWRMDSFPAVSVTYSRDGYPQIPLPKPPFQSLDWFQYVDTFGTVQTLTRDTTYGHSSSFYGFQLTPGSSGGGIMPARLTPPWARPWPPQLQVPANTLIQFRAGFGGPVAGCSMSQSSAVLTSPGFKFNPDDAPQLTGDVGTAVSVPGAGANGAALVTNVASVDSNGVATLAAAATAAVSNATVWVGDPIPEDIQLAIHFQAQFYNENGGVVDAVQPRVIDAIRNSGLRNLVS